MTDAKSSFTPLIVHGADPLSGRFLTPGDAGISQRLLMLAALSVGQSSIVGLRPSTAVLATIASLRQMGVTITQSGDQWLVQGLGVAGLLEPEGPLTCAPDGQNLALLLGLLAPYGFATRLGAPGESKLRVPPALLEGLTAVGANVSEQDDGSVLMQGAYLPLPIRRDLNAPDEELKTALLLAALQVAGTSEIHETVAAPDHTEKLLAAFGADIVVTPDAEDAEGAMIRLAGLPTLRPQAAIVYGDTSAAAFAIVAALIIKGSDVVVENVLINPRRTGLIDTLLEMGGDIQFINQREVAGEYIADLRVRSSWLKGISVDARHARTLLGDMPALAIAAAFAQGETVINGLGAPHGGLRDTLAAGLVANKVDARAQAESLTIIGEGKVAGGGQVDCKGDAAIALSFAVLGMGSRHKVTITDASAIGESFPDFVTAMTALGGRFPPQKGR